MRKLISIVVVLIAILGIWNWITGKNKIGFVETVKIVTEESVVIDTVKKVQPSVVTVAGEQPTSDNSFNFGPFSIFGLPGPRQSDEPSSPQAIGSGFVVSEDGLIITNKHVVSDRQIKYQIITASDKTYPVERIYRDPLNDVAILKITPPSAGLKPVTLGDSQNLQVGQFVIAIGTALGEFRSTVTTGVISGLGRGITAGSEFEGFIERLDNVIQTDAAINPGNSGGPLLNSKAQVIGVNTAVASSGQNIGFALPINIIKDSLKNFNENGQFSRPYLGIAYKILNRQIALANDVPQGAYVQDVIEDSPAQKAGITRGDIIILLDGKKIGGDKNEIATIIAKKKIGDTVKISVWRNGKTLEVTTTLVVAPNQ